MDAIRVGYSLGDLRDVCCVNTFSIVGCDPTTGDVGVAVQSKFLAVGAVVPWARGGVGAVATQAWANTSYGPLGLDLLVAGLPPKEALTRLTGADERPAQRQVGIVAVSGRSATYTGPECPSWAGGIAGPSFAAQGNSLVGPDTVHAMAGAFETAYGALSHRLLTALAAGQRAGGDRRGQQSAALLVVRAGGGYGGFNDRMIDLRVDDHPHPIEELARLLELHELLFLKPEPSELVEIDAAIARELQERLVRTGDYHGPVTGEYDAATRAALEDYAGRENLEERLQPDARIDRKVLAYLREHTD